MRSSILLLLSVFFMPLRIAAQAGPIPGGVPVRPVFDKADVVCSLRVDSAKIVRLQGGGTNGAAQDFVRVTGKILDVYKSDLTPPGSLVFQFPEDPMSNGATGFREGDVVLLFLSKGNSVYELADPYVGLRYFSRLDPVPGNPGFDKLESALLLVLQRGNHDDQVNALELLEGFDRLAPATMGAVSVLISSADPRVALAALSVLLRTGTPASVARFAAYLETYKEERPPIELFTASGALSGVTDPAARVDIERLSGDMHTDVRRAAMYALRHIASAKSAPVLIQRLDDPDGNVSYLALITLAEIFHKYGDYAPNDEFFDKDPQQYIRRWKDWWNTEGKNMSQ